MKRIIIFAALAAFALTSCQQEITIEESKPEGLVFTATTEIPATKTALDASLNVVWQAGDEITVMGGSSIGTYTTTADGDTKATFTHHSGTEATTSPYKAWYPTTLYDNVTLVLPATQTYTAGNITGNPMYAESETANLSFKNICGIIKLNISTTQTGKKVRKIVLSADQGMSGEISNVATLGTDLTAAVSGTAGVTLDCGTEGVEIGSTAIPFYIAVPAKTYSNLKIMVITADDEFQTRTAKSDIVVGRSSITDITLGFNNLSAISNLVHYWPFNGNTNDAVTSGAINGTNTGATLTTDRFGNADSAYYFDGNDSIEVGQAGSFESSDSFSFNVWINSTGGGNFIRTEGGGGSWGWFVRFVGEGKIQIWEGTYTSYTAETTESYNDGNWHMVTFVRDASNNIGRLYVDGEEKCHYDMPSGPQPLTSAYLDYLGSYGDGEFFSGKMDEVRLYNKALTAEEVAALYQY